MQQQYLKLDQHSAVKDLEAALPCPALPCPALRSVKRAGLVVVGVDGALLVAVGNDDLEQDMRSRSACEAILERHNNDCPLTHAINHYGCYRDSGGA